MGDHPNAALMRSAFEAFQGGNPGALGALLADDVVWHEIGAETLHGAAAVAESMSGLAGFDVEMSLHDVVGNDEHVVGLVEVTVKTDRGAFTYRTAEINHVADGKITERWAFSDDTAAIADFFSGAGG